MKNENENENENVWTKITTFFKRHVSIILRPMTHVN